jgi:hypothetical protein
MKPLFVFFMLFMAKASIGQDIKSLEYAKQYQKNKVQSRRCVEIRYNGNIATDTVLISLEEFDRSGRISRYIEYDRHNSPVAEYHFEYDAAGQIRMSVSHKYSDWMEVTLVPEFDEKRRMISRSPVNKPHGFWEKETFNYDASGKLLSRDHWYVVDGVHRPLINKAFPETVEKNENSLSYIYDEHDLLIIEQLYRNGVSDKSRNYQYTFY